MDHCAVRQSCASLTATDLSEGMLGWRWWVRHDRTYLDVVVRTHRTIRSRHPHSLQARGRNKTSVYKEIPLIGVGVSTLRASLATRESLSALGALGVRDVASCTRAASVKTSAMTREDRGIGIDALG